MRVGASRRQTASGIAWWRPEFNERDERAAVAAVRSQYVNEGAVTRRFENTLAAYLGARHAVAATSGTAALYLALRALDIGPGDEVIVPDITFVATANAVAMTGAVPVLADIDPETLTLDPDAARRVMTKRTKAVIPVHVSGRSGTIDAVLALARKKGLAVVEDAAEALGSKTRGRFLGTLGRLGCFSFSPNKTITTGQGGLVVTGDAALARRLRALKDQGRTEPGTGGDDRHPLPGGNFKLTNLQAAVGLSQFASLKSRLGRMRRIHALYREDLAGVRQVRVFPFDLRAGETPQWTDIEAEDRDGLERRLRRRGIVCRKFWFPVHRHPPYRRADAGFPNAVRLTARSLWLPSAFQLRDADVRRVTRLIREHYA